MSPRCIMPSAFRSIVRLRRHAERRARSDVPETPIVATDAGGTRELMTDGIEGLIVPPGNVSVLTHAIETMLARPDAGASMAAAARSRVERELSFASRMRKIESIYEELAAKVAA